MLNLVWRYLLNLIIWAFDESLNVLRGGDPGESISVAAAKARKQGKPWGCKMCKILDVIFRKDHCTDALKNFGQHSLWGD